MVHVSYSESIQYQGPNVMPTLLNWHAAQLPSFGPDLIKSVAAPRYIHPTRLQFVGLTPEIRKIWQLKLAQLWSRVFRSRKIDGSSNYC